MSRVSRYTVDVDDRGEWGGMAGGEGEGEGEGEMENVQFIWRAVEEIAGEMCDDTRQRPRAK